MSFLFPSKKTSQMTSYFFIGFEMHSRTVLAANYLLSMWHRFGNTETVNQAPALTHTLSTPLTEYNNIARRADFSNREINTEQPSRCTSSFVSACRRASPRNLLGNVEKKNPPPRYFESSTYTPREFPEYQNKKIRIRRGCGRHIEAHRTTCRWRGRQQTPS